MTSLTPKEAYLAMYRFMETLILRDMHDGLLDMISSMSLLPDGRTADLGMWYDWEQTLLEVKGNAADLLTPEEAFTAMRSFLERYNARGSHDSIVDTLARISPRPSGEFSDFGLWNDWLNAVKAAKMHTVDANLRLQK